MNNRYHSFKQLAMLLVLSGFVLSCGGSGGGSTDSTIANTSNNSTSSQGNLSGTVQPDPADPTSNGKNAGATVYVVGQQDKATTTDSSGNFNLNVDPTLSGTVLSSPSFIGSLFKAASVTKTFGLVVLSSGKTHGRKTAITTTDGKPDPVSTIYVNTVGTISGKATLQGQTDHTGIRVYIPGTSFQATTDMNGNYTVSNVPEGTYDIVRADYPGTVYHYAVTAKVVVMSANTTVLSDMLLQTSVGSNGSILINRGAAYTTSATVDIAVAPTVDAVLMQIADDVNFTGLSWENVKPVKRLTLAGDFSAGKTATVYAKFADMSGLASSLVSTSIYVDTNPLVNNQLPINMGTISDTKPVLSWKYTPPIPNPKYHIQVATDVGFTNIVSGQDKADLTVQQHSITTSLVNLTKYYWRVAIIDEQGRQWNWAGPWSFTIDLSTVTLSSPLTASDFNASENDLGIQFSWQTNVHAASYILTVCYNDATVSCGTTYTIVSPIVTKTIPKILSSDGTYYWAVTPVDMNGVPGKRSDVWNFKLDTVAPGVSTRIPLNAATGVSKIAPISVTFDEAIDSTTIITPATAFTISSGGSAVNGTVTYDANTKTATFTPTSALSFSTLYSATVGTDVKDVVGNPLAATAQWSFTTRNTIEGWAFIDGNGTNGLNFDNGQHAYNPYIAAFNSKLYVTWLEPSVVGGRNILRLKTYNGTSWPWDDGGTATGLNSMTDQIATSSPILTVFGSKLMLSWEEFTMIGMTSIVKIKGFDGGSTWTWENSSLNYCCGANGGRGARSTVNSGSYYITWAESSSSYPQIRASIYTGSTWSRIDGNMSAGVNKNPLNNGIDPDIASYNNKVYIAWIEDDPGAIASQIRVAVFTGSTWSFVDGNNATYGLNVDTSKNAQSVSLAVYNNKLYAAWHELDALSVEQIRVKSFNGITWTAEDGGASAGINKSSNYRARDVAMTVFNSKLYFTWWEYDANSIGQIRVKSYDGNTWSFDDGNGATGINRNTANVAQTPKLAVYNNKLYLTWVEVTVPNTGIGQTRVAVTK